MKMIKKYGKWLAAFFAAMCLLAHPAAVNAADTAAAQADETAISEETVSEVLDFIKEKWDDGAFENEEDIQKAIEEGEEKFGVTLEEGVKEQITKVLRKVDDWGLDPDTAIDTAKKLYEEKGAEITEQLQDMYKEYGDKMADHAEDILKENLVEPAKQAAKAAVENTAKNFIQDLKSSVVSFFRNIFE